MTRTYTSKDISHLQADVLTGDAFRRGVIRSGTNYQVYSVGLKGTHPHTHTFLPANRDEDRRAQANAGP